MAESGYFSKTVRKGSQQAVISGNTIAGPFRVALYLNHGESISLRSGKAKTLKGAEQVAARLLG